MAAFLGMHGGPQDVGYVRYLRAVLGEAEAGFRREAIYGAAAAASGSTAIGLVFQRVDDKPRAFGDATLCVDNAALLAFLKARPVAEHAHSGPYVIYLRSVLDAVATALGSG